MIRLYFIICVFFILFCVPNSLLAQNNFSLLEPGGISLEGRMFQAKSRVRSVLLPPTGCFKLSDKYSVVNCMSFNSLGAFAKEERFYRFKNNYIVWHSEDSVRFSFSSSGDNKQSINYIDSIIEDTLSYDIYKEYLLLPNNIKYLNPHYVNVFSTLKDYTFRIPRVVVFNNGNILVACDAYKHNNKIGYYVALSKDKGNSFKLKKIDIPLEELVYDKTNDKLFSITSSACYISHDYGLTWTVYSKYNLKIDNGYNKILTSPTVGIQLSNGILLAPMRMVYYKRDSLRSPFIERTTNFILFSRDYGKTWLQSCSTPDSIVADESTIIEYKDNSVLLNVRGGTEWFWNQTANGRRVFVGNASSKDKNTWNIESWDLEPKSDGEIWDPLCHASMITLESNGNHISLFSSPFIPYQYTPRRNIVLQYSNNSLDWNYLGCLTEPERIILGYSSLAFGNNNLFFCYEDSDGSIQLSNITEFVNFLFNH